MNRIKELYLRLFKGYELKSSHEVQKQRLMNHPKNKQFEVIAARKYKQWWIDSTSHYLVKPRQ